MTTIDPASLRRATPWFCWPTSQGAFYATVADALRSPEGPADATRLLVQYRFDDDGSLAGRAKPVFPNQIGSS